MLRAAIVLANELLASRHHAPLAATMLDAENIGTALSAAKVRERGSVQVENTIINGV